MTFKSIVEQFYDYAEMPSYMKRLGAGEAYPIYENPSTKEFRDLFQYSDRIRMIGDAESKKVYAFPGSILHAFVYKEIYGEEVDLKGKNNPYLNPKFFFGGAERAPGKPKIIYNAIFDNGGLKTSQKLKNAFKKQDWTFLDRYFETSYMKK